MEFRISITIVAATVATAAAALSAAAQSRPVPGGTQTRAVQFLKKLHGAPVPLGKTAPKAAGWSPAGGWAYRLDTAGPDPESVYIDPLSGAVTRWRHRSAAMVAEEGRRRFTPDQTRDLGLKWVMKNVPQAKGRRLTLLGGVTLGTSAVDAWGWVDRIGPQGARSPNTISVDVNAVTGEVVRFDAPVHSIVVPLVPKLTREQAVAIAGREAAPSAEWGRPKAELAVNITPAGVQYLAWEVAYPLPLDDEASRKSSDYSRVFVDALTGSVVFVTAPFGSPTAARFPAGKPPVSDPATPKLRTDGQDFGDYPRSRLKKNVVLAPAEVLQRLGVMVEHKWNQPEALLTLATGRQLRVRAGQPSARYTSGETVDLESSPELSGGRLWVPVRSLARLSGWSAQWNPKECVLDLTSPMASAH